MNFREFIKDRIVYLDGAMGTVMQTENLLNEGEVPENLNLRLPKSIFSIHRNYVSAGSDVVCTNTFQANRIKLPSFLKLGDVIKNAVNNARDAHPKYVSLDIGPTGKLIEPMGDMSFEEAYDIFEEIVREGIKNNVDVFSLETFTSLYELRAAVLAVRNNTDIPIIASMSFDGNRSISGATVEAMAVTLERLGVDVIGFNCSTGPLEGLENIKKLASVTSLPIVAKFNAGVPNGKTYTPTEFADAYQKLVEAGATLIGGCCGTSRKYIDELKKRNFTYPDIKKGNVNNYICSEQKAVDISLLNVVGERINPTGKKLYKQALIDGDYSYAEKEAIRQVEAGATVLDVNCGLPDIDEVEALTKTVKAIQSKTDAPLMIDSTNPIALKNALMVYNGIAIVNSVNGDDETLDTILPLVKKYGASVVGLCLDKNGIPKSALERIKIALKIMKKAYEYGIDKDRVIIDALTMTVATNEYLSQEILKVVYALSMDGIKTTLGVSNISFGLPCRDKINAMFLTQAIGAGLKLPIVNPYPEEIKEAVLCSKTLLSDSVARELLAQKVTDVEQKTTDVNKGTLEYCIEKGLKDEASKLTNELLKTMSPIEIIEQKLTPSLDKVGKLYEAGTIFLPGLIGSADAAKCACDVIKQAMKGNEKIEKGKIIIATVKGDIHDIGKNIVKAVLENYGYRIIDLGKDVTPETIVERAIKEDVKLIGLSALMTTTAKNMQETIKKLKEAGYKGKTMVGGAVINAEYAVKIGADFYTKDANASVKVAKEVLG